MATVTGTLTVNAAFMREIKDDNKQLRRLLREIRAISTPPLVLRLHATRFVTLLGDLRDQLALHFALEEAYGYFEDAVDVAPRLAERAEHLRTQHAMLYETIRDLSEEAAETVVIYSSQSISRLGSIFNEFDAQLRQHDAEENQLMFEAFEQDIGVGD